MNEVYFLEISDMVEGKKTFPAYTCGHCSNVIMINPKRSERRTCLSCGRWLCGTNELCNAGCTPIHSMANDHFEGAGDYGKFIPALMQGVTTLEEGGKKGLIP